MRLPGSLWNLAGAFALVVALGAGARAADKESDATQGKAGKAEQSNLFREEVRPIFENHCVHCHDAITKKGGLDLTSPKGILRGGELGAVVVEGNADESLLLKRLRAGEMPPKEAQDTLSPEEFETIEKWIRGGASFGDERNEVVLSQHDVLPILTLRCTVCHGSKRKFGELDLTSKEAMLRGGMCGPAVVPHKPEDSRLITRIREGKCPPAALTLDYGVRRPSEGEIEKLRGWIEGGCLEDDSKPWAPSPAGDPLVSDADRDFWAFKPPRASAPPEFAEDDDVRNAIDAFVLHKLKEKGFTFAQEAERGALIRRAFFDLTGLPPTPDELEKWQRDGSEKWYERMLDALLASSHYGERWGRHWLDVAGYADSEGKTDEDRLRPYAWRYRDYVIRSFNADKPYDRFLMEQLAGDELADYESAPEITKEIEDNLVATAFLRLGPDNTWTRDSNLTPERLDVVSNSMEVLGSGVMGLTLNCARCHSHKYDPLPQRDYYRLRDIFKGALDEHDWMRPALAEGVPFGSHQFAPRYLKKAPEEERRVWEEEQKVVRVLKAEVEAEEKRLHALTSEKELAKHPPELQKKLREYLAAQPGQYTDEQKELAKAYEDKLRPLRFILKGQNPKFREMCNRLEKLERPEPMIAALWDRGEPSDTYIYRRGEYDNFGELVTAGVPSMLSDGETPFEYGPPWPGAKSTGRRLAFAKWLTRPDHPLTARVMVNRVWMLHFGRGIVATPHNFGKTGAAPSHPELLDWLAVDFAANGWSVKRLHKNIMMSRAYRQSSAARPELAAIDADNVLIGRMPLRRLDAEELHDALLSVSGRLDTTPFGPGDDVEKRKGGTVSPVGYRRSVYVKQMRNSLPTLMTTFDLPSMAPNCVARTVSTVAPQALVMLNGDSVQDAADEIAMRVQLEVGEDTEKQIERVYLLAFSRKPSAQEIAIGKEAIEKLTAEWLEAEVTEKERHPRQMALENYCHAILNSAEFLYVE